MSMTISSMQPEGEDAQSAATSSDLGDANGSPVTVGELMAVLRRVRRHAVLIWWATTLFGVAGLAALGLALALVIDHLLVLPAILRATLLLAVLVGPIWFVRARWRDHPAGSEEELALLIERRYPSLDNALINSVQLSRHSPEGSEDIVAAITQQAHEAVRSIRPSAAVSKRMLAAATGIVAFAGLLLGSHAVASSEGLAMGLHRVLAPFADNTLTRIVEVSPGEADFLVGEEVEVAVQVAGRVPTRAELVGVYPDGQSVRLGMAAPSPGNPERLTVTIDRLDQSMRYRVHAGDDRSGSYELRVHEPPVVQQITQRIRPPEYLRPIVSERREESGGTIRALAGSEVELQIEATTPFERGLVRVGEGDEAKELPIEVPGSGPGAMGLVTLPVPEPGEGAAQYEIELTHALGFASEPVAYDIIAEPDRSPQVSFVEPAQERLEVAIDAQLELRIDASDEHALRKLELVQLDPDWQNLSESERQEHDPTPVAGWSFEPGETARASKEHRVAVADLGLDEDAPVVLQAIAHDFNPAGTPGRSAPVTLGLEAEQVADDGDDDESAYSRVSLEELIELQRRNIAVSELYQAAAEQIAAEGIELERDDTLADAGIGEIDGLETLEQLLERQEDILEEAVNLAEATTGAAANNPVIQRRMKNLAKSLMPVAVRQLDRVDRSRDRGRAMGEAVETQREILKQLIIADVRQDSALQEQRHREISRALAELISKQTALHEDTLEEAATAAALGARQRMLTREAANVQRMMQREADRGAGGDADLAEQYETAAAMFDEREVRASMIVVVEHFGDESLGSAASIQEQVLADLKAIEALLREANLREAEEELGRVAEELRETKEKVDKLVDLQEAITEVARDMEARADLRDEDAQETGEFAQDLTEARENIADAIEQLAKDLHIHPDLNVSNDLLTDLAEIYEQVDQVPGSEESPVSENAIARDEGTLEMLKEMQEEMGERMADSESWLPDTPNASQFERENFDRDEMGDIPLGDLPDAMEDLVGDMLDYNQELRDEALDAASNMHFPDMEFGQEVRDGDLVSWAAKGKSGNEPPQELDQTGRSGAGRQGMAHGEIVGDEIKALEGSDVHARRTPEGFQSGELMEEDPEAMDVKATGGGKLAGVSPGEGMQGDAPARDLMHLREMERRHRSLERDAETLYSMATLLKLPTHELDEALLQMHAARRQLEAGDLLGYAQSQEQVVRSFASTHARLRGREAVTAGDSQARIAEAIVGATQEPVPEHYEEAVAEYMRRIAERQ